MHNPLKVLNAQQYVETIKTSKFSVAYEVGFWDGKLHNQKLLQYFDCHGRGATQITSWKNLKHKVTKRRKMRFSFTCPASGRLLINNYSLKSR